jgi:DNA adenine methylase
MIELGAHDNSPLRYPGGKARRSLRLLRFADQSRKHYVEPLAGGLGMLFRAKRENLFQKYYANDLDTNLVNFYSILRDYPDELIKQLWTCYRQHGARDEELFYQSRENPASSNDINRAVAYFIINKWPVKGDLDAGMMRTSKRRSGISPMLLNRLPIFSELLNGVTLTNLDYQNVKIPCSAFAFLDPPYENVGASLYKHKVNLN